SFALELGGGPRFWFGDHFSFAPTIEGLYGHTASDYTARSAFATMNLAEFRELGIVDWTTDTWTIVPAGELRYVFDWRRAHFKLSSAFDFYYTQSFRASNPNLTVGGASETWKNLVELDIPLGLEVFGHELRTGGVFSRTEIYGDVETAFHTDHLYQAH